MTVVAAPVFPPGMVLQPLRRRPLRLPDETVAMIMAAPLPPAKAEVDQPRVSIVVVTYNQVVFTRACLATVLSDDQPADEVIVVDNASTDGTRDYLRELAKHSPRVRLVLNERNRGFAPAVNQGLRMARGNVLVALNNDTLVPPGWLTGLLRHLNDRRVGLVGPTTNAAPNEAQVEAPYTVYGSFEAFAEQRARQYAGRQIDVSMLTMFCLAMRRETYEELGPLDERFEVGLFEDDDYSRRAHAAGMQVVCAEDVFVHHFGEASFGELVPSGEYAALFERNRQRFEQKWGDAWQAHQRRRSSTYESLIARIRSLAERAVPEEATVLVLSKGDTLLLQLGERRVGWHFPRLADGTYAGYYPADGGEAIAQLEQLRTAGADHLVVPATSLWWLDHYPEFGQHLEQHYALLVHEPETGSIYFVGRRRDQ